MRGVELPGLRRLQLEDLVVLGDEAPTGIPDLRDHAGPLGVGLPFGRLVPVEHPPQGARLRVPPRGGRAHRHPASEPTEVVGAHGQVGGQGLPEALVSLPIERQGLEEDIVGTGGFRAGSAWVVPNSLPTSPLGKKTRRSAGASRRRKWVIT